MSVRCLCTLTFLVLLDVAVCGGDEIIRSEGSTERQVQIGAHGSLASVGASSDETIAEGRVIAVNSKSHHEDGFVQQKASRNAGPKVTGYETAECDGQNKGSWVLPHGVNLREDHCIEVTHPETSKPIGRMKMSCDHTGLAQVCIWNNANDTSCTLSEPFCLHVSPGDTFMASAGNCLPVREHPNEKDGFARFTDFPLDTKWPDCLVPPMSMSLMLIVVMGGVCAGFLVLCGFWQMFFSLPSHPHKHMPGGLGKGGKGKGGWGAYGKGEPHPGHESGELDADGNALPASLPGVPAMPATPAPPQFKGDPHMMKGKMGPPQGGGWGGKGGGWGGKH